MLQERKVLSATIPAGQSLSNALEIIGRPIVAFIIPPGWDNATLTFLNGEEKIDYMTVYDSKGKELELPVVGEMFIKVTGQEWLGFGSLILRSGTSNNPVNQTAERVIGVVLAL